ncbi:MAG TPA: DeoR family transcriptional regulator [Firmicutes bacterium]|jgi:DeoR family fructose operon transcriptional repressor|nr:DeoR family transcriptional regulator [Bacillota bacterium]
MTGGTRVLAEERRTKILQAVDENGSATVVDLSNLMHVSLMTIRRDINKLATDGLVVKAHGGVLSLRQSTATEPRYDVKARVNVEEKKRIGAFAAELVAHGDTVLLDAGSTTYQIAVNLIHKQNLTVVTNDLLIASELGSCKDIVTLLVGGTIRHGMFSTVGQYCEETLRQISVDKVFLGADAVHHKKGVMNCNPHEVLAKRLMLEAAQERILVVDHLKFQKIGLSFVCGIDALDMIITDNGVDATVVSDFADCGVSVKMC